MPSPQTAERKFRIAVAKHNPVVGGESLRRHDALNTESKEEKYMIDEKEVQNQEVRQRSNGLRVACETPRCKNSSGNSVQDATDHNADKQGECRDYKHDNLRHGRPPGMRY